MNVTIDANSGFCFGVVYAIQMAEDELDANGSLFCLGDIVHNNMEVDKWKKFVRDENLEFKNVSRNQFIMTQDSATKLIYGGKTTLQSLNFHQYWDVNSTPKVYLMDKDKKIIAKSLGAEQLEDLLNRLENGSDTSAPLKETEYEDEDEAPAKKRLNSAGKSKPTNSKPNKN
jgi:hypothetical protein